MQLRFKYISWSVVGVDLVVSFSWILNAYGSKQLFNAGTTRKKNPQGIVEHSEFV